MRGFSPQLLALLCVENLAPPSGKEGFIIGTGGCGDSLHCQVNRVSLLVYSLVIAVISVGTAVFVVVAV